MRNRRKILERAALAVMAVGILMVWQPWLHVFFRLGFFVTISGTIAFIVAAHLPGGASADAGDGHA
jgi:hypothetical protein